MNHAKHNPSPAVPVPVTYCREWRDGLGARGWKLDVSIGEPSVIAATAEHGTRIPTSVLVHDILDHHLCGFGIGGHRNEAMALMQLASRTGADPYVDFRQIVTEDLMHGHCNGESLRSFLPRDLTDLIPKDVIEGKAIINFLTGELGSSTLFDRLVKQFAAIGKSVQQQVEAHWQYLGLDYHRRTDMGMALQRLLTQIDTVASEQDWVAAHGKFVVGNNYCSAELSSPIHLWFEEPVTTG